MRHSTLFFIVMVLLVFCKHSSQPEIAKILESQYEERRIASGDNRPAINLSEDNLRDLLILLHYRVTPDDIKAFFSWEDDDLRTRLDILLENDFIHYHESGKYLPSCMVISEKDGKELQRLAKTVSRPIAEIIASKTPEIKRHYETLGAFEGIPFQDASLLILSNVVLDNWQIDNIEKTFIKAERTARHGKNYYFAIREKVGEGDLESFGIYGNSIRSFGNIRVGIYGNRRLGRNFITLTEKQLIELFGMPAEHPVNEFKAQLLEELVQLAEEPEFSVDTNHKDGFNHLGLMNGSRLGVPIVRKDDYFQLGAIAYRASEDIISVLEAHKDRIQSSYQKSIYGEEITFEEYFIWWYHFLYTDVTNLLAADRGLIATPSSGVSTYLVKW